MVSNDVNDTSLMGVVVFGSLLVRVKSLNDNDDDDDDNVPPTKYLDKNSADMLYILYRIEQINTYT